ncbi:MAG: polysaccharide deacetylase family protein [Candidatus Omnitrophica bacterium]|nr:polysaccharide deacetylase family protein [Candidatus Omnitrophota bacterium]
MENIKHKISWSIGAVLCAIFYYCGIIWVYTFVQKRILKKSRTVVLMYHRVGDDIAKDSEITVSNANFDEQMKFLKNKFKVIDLDSLIDGIGKESDSLSASIAITFDDGYKDNYENAYPILRKYQLPAAIFLVSRLIGNNGEILNLEEINIMKDNNIDFGSHTLSHKILADIGIDDARKEVTSSKVELAQLLDREIKYFAYPKGKKRHFNEQVKLAVKEAGYKAAFSTENGEITRGCDVFELKRIGMRNYPLFVFKVRLSGIFESKLFYFVRKKLKLT